MTQGRRLTRRSGTPISARAITAGLACFIASILGAAAEARAESHVYARVIVEAAPVRSRPGPSGRLLHRAHRGDYLRVLARPGYGGHLLEVELPDGTHAFVESSLVYVAEVDDTVARAGRFLPDVFAAPPVAVASGEVAVGIGYLFGTDAGMLAIRPSWLLAPAFGFEATLAAAVSSGGRVFFAGVGPIVNLFPESPVVPFATIGGGASLTDPNADAFLLTQGTTALIFGGAGLRIGFRHRITIRIDVRAYAFYTPNKVVTQQEVSGGFTVFL